MSRLLTQTYYFNRLIPNEEIVRNLEDLNRTSLAEISERAFASVTDTFAVALCGPSLAKGLSFH